MKVLQTGNFAIGYGNGIVKIWENKNNFKCIKTLNKHKDNVYCMAFLPNGNLVTGSKDNTIKIWDRMDTNTIFLWLPF